MKLAGYDVSLDWRRQLETAEQSVFRLAAKVAFVLAFLMALAILFTAPPAAAFAGGVFATLMLRAVLPSERFQALARSYWSGEAGKRWHRRWEAILDWVGKQTDRLVRMVIGLKSLLWRE